MTRGYQGPNAEKYTKLLKENKASHRGGMSVEMFSMMLVVGELTKTDPTTVIDRWSDLVNEGKSTIYGTGPQA